MKSSTAALHGKDSFGVFSTVLTIVDIGGRGGSVQRKVSIVPFAASSAVFSSFVTRSAPAFQTALPLVPPT